MKKLLVLIGFQCFAIFAFSQDSIFSYKEYLAIVKKHHPIAYQADLSVARGQANLQKAKGGFDPKLSAEIDQKYFNDETYYSRLNSKLKVPTWFGITAQAGYEQNDGKYLNPELTNPANGLVQAGVAITLGKGLFMDERRAELNQAKIYANSSVLEQKIILNQLEYNASVAYWKWKTAFLKMQIYERSIENARYRFEGIKQSVILGDKPAIDTLEAYIIMQNRILGYESMKMEFNTARLKLNVFLWQDGFIPLELDSFIYPNTDMDYLLDKIVYSDSMLDNHPELLLYKNKVAIQRIDNRLQREALKPTLDLRYDFLSEPIGSSPIGNPSIQNYKWGATFSYPIFVRKGRAEAKLSEISIQEAITDTELKKASLKYTIEAVNTYRINLANQLTITTKMVENYAQLFTSENALFTIGESSVFMVNSRERSLISAQLKAVEIYAELMLNTQEYIYHLFQ